MSIRLKKPHNVETDQKVTLKRRKVKLEQKIEIFEEFMKTEEKLVGNTIFKGYPIGQWAIQIRNSFNRMNNGKDDKVKISLTKEKLEKLESMGILERQIDSTIDEKIDSLVEWRRKYPKIKITPIATDEELREYARTDEEFVQIQEEYEKMQRYYDYVRLRKHQGKLNEEQMKRLKEGKIGGVFGYPTRIEELAKRYGILEKDIDYLLTKFGTLDNFYEMHNTGKIEDKKDRTLEEKIIRNVVDMDDNSNMGYDNLYRDILAIKKREPNVYFYSSKRLQEALETLGKREKYVIESIYGLTEGTTPTTLENVGRELGMTGRGVSPIKNKAFRKLRHPARVRKYRITFESECLTDEERQSIEKLKKDIQLQNGNLYENLGKLKEIKERLDKEKERIDKEKERLAKEEEERIDKEKERLAKEEEERFNKLYKTEEERLDVKDVGFSVRTYNALKRTGINYLGDLENVTEERLKKVRNFGKKGFEELVAKMQEFGISFKTKEQLDKERIETQEKRQQELSEEREKIDDIRVETEQDKTEITSENKVETEEQLAVNDEQKKKEINFEDIEKSKLIQRLLEQQQIIDAQQAEIYRLKKLLGQPQQ